MKLCRPALTMILGLILSHPPLAAAQDKTTGTAEPSSGLIEFLGEFRDDDVGFVNPLEFLRHGQQLLETLVAKGAKDEQEPVVDE